MLHSLFYPLVDPFGQEGDYLHAILDGQAQEMRESEKISVGNVGWGMERDLNHFGEKRHLAAQR